MLAAAALVVGVQAVQAQADSVLAGRVAVAQASLGVLLRVEQANLGVQAVAELASLRDQLAVIPLALSLVGEAQSLPTRPMYQRLGATVRRVIPQLQELLLIAIIGAVPSLAQPMRLLIVR